MAVKIENENDHGNEHDWRSYSPFGAQAGGTTLNT
jgi:hypothetical protein